MDWQPKARGHSMLDSQCMSILEIYTRGLGIDTIEIEIQWNLG